MKPYGWKKWLCRDEDYGPTSKHTGGVTRGRHRFRQLLHKMGRRQGDKSICEQVADSEGNEADHDIESDW